MLTLLNDMVKGCTKCGLCSGRRQTVFGEGSVSARVFIIGEGPGEQEDKHGRPFVGPAGDVLDQIIRGCGWQREDVYIGNIVKCRPPYNRTPDPDEVAECINYLRLQVKIVNPPYIVCMGRTAANYFLEKDLPISAMRGLHYHEGRMVLCTYHPSYLLHKKDEAEYVKVAQDFKQLLDYMNAN